MLLKFLFFLSGAFIGSFLNVCIYRMPKSESIVFPGSHCVHCNKYIKWYENIPLVSYILLTGKCSNCKKPISFRYFTVELLTGLLFLAFYMKFGLTANLPIFLVLGCGLIVATFIDFEYQLIPDTVSLGGLALGLLINIFYPGLFAGQHGMPIFNAALGAFAGGASIYMIGVLGKMVFKKDAMGFGDVKFLAMIGAFIGWQKVLLVFFIAPFFGAFVGIILKVRYKIETIPYGPYLSLATIVVIIWGDSILSKLFYF